MYIYIIYIISNVRMCEELYYVSYNQCILRVELGLIDMDCQSMEECIKTISRKKNACCFKFFYKSKRV